MKFVRNKIERQSIIESLIELTEKNNKHRKYDCEINNPVLILNIIFRSFAKARMNNSNVVTIKNICDSIEDNPNLYDSAIEKTILDINSLDSIEEQEKSEKVKILNFPSNRV